MKRWFIISALLMAMSLPLTGCNTLGYHGSSWQDNVPQLKSDVFILSKLATRLTLSEAGMVSNDRELVLNYLTAIRDILAVPGEPNFSGARNLVTQLLPAKYVTYGFVIIDLLERCVATIDISLTENQKLVIDIISSGINGAIEGVNSL